MADQAPDPRLGTEIAGYRVQKRIGRGGMGVVYLGEHRTLRRQAAVKVIAPELTDSEGFRERFIREARIAATLTHPNVVTVYDAGEIEGLLYIAMQYVPGHDLHKVLAREGRLGPYRALDVCRQVGSALDDAHRHGLIHRDVKPGNVLIDGRHAYLTDFGLTKARSASLAQLTRSGEVVGTTHYLAPEQVEGRDLDGRADVYALACLLYHCLTGSVPFPRESDMAVMYAHVHEEPPRITEARPGLPAGLDAVLSKAMDKSPDRRFATCEELILAARAVVDAHGPLAESSSTRRPSTAQRYVPPEGDQSSVATSASRPYVPPEGDTSSVHTLTGVVGPSGRRAIVLLGAMDSQSRAVARVALTGKTEVLEAQEPDDILTLSRAQRPDVVLLDASRAEDTAAAVCTALRADPVTRDAKIVLLVSGRDAGRRVVSKLGADDSIARPFSPLQIQVKLRRLLRKGAVGG